MRKTVWSSSQVMQRPLQRVCVCLVIALHKPFLPLTFSALAVLSTQAPRRFVRHKAASTSTLSTLIGCGAVWSAGRRWRSSSTHWRRTTPRRRGKKRHPKLNSRNQNTLLLSLMSLPSCLLKEQQSRSSTWKYRLAAETCFPARRHPTQTCLSSSRDSDLRPSDREADPKGPSGVTATPICPDVRIFVALWTRRAI